MQQPATAPVPPVVPSVPPPLVAKPVAQFGGLPLQTTTELRLDRGLLLVFVGPPTIGKTTLVNTMFESKHVENVLHGDIEGGAFVLRDDPRLLVVSPKTWRETLAVVAALEARTPNPKTGKPFDTFISDNYCAIQIQNLKHRGLYEARPDDMLAIYSKSMNDMVDLTRRLMELARGGMHVVLNCWDDDEVDKKTGAAKTGIYMTPKLVKYFRGVVDYIGLLLPNDAPGNPYPPIISFQLSTQLPTRTRIAPDDPNMTKLPRIIYNPSIGSIIDLWHGEPWPTARHSRGGPPAAVGASTTPPPAAQPPTPPAAKEVTP